MRTRQGSRAGGDGPRRDHHDWASETYVEPFPAALDQHLAALKAVGFKAVLGGYA